MIRNDRLDNEWLNLVEELRGFRIDQKISQRELASMLGFSSNSIVSEWESGKTIPSSLSLLKWVSVLGKEVAIVNRRRVLRTVS